MDREPFEQKSRLTTGMTPEQDMAATRENRPIRSPRRRRSSRYESEPASPAPSQAAEKPSVSEPERNRSANVRYEHSMVDKARRPAPAPVRTSVSQPVSHPVSRPAGQGYSRMESRPSLRVGYPGGRMDEAGHSRESEAAGMSGTPVPAAVKQHSRGQGTSGWMDFGTEPEPRKASLVLRILTLLLCLVGLAMAAVMLLPEDSVIRRQAGSTAKGLTAFLPADWSATAVPVPQETPMPTAGPRAVWDFMVMNESGNTPPTISLTTSRKVSALRLVRLDDEDHPIDGGTVATTFTFVDNEEETYWVLTILEEDGLTGKAELQIQEDGDWLRTGMIQSFNYVPAQAVAAAASETPNNGLGELLETVTEAPTEEPTPAPTEEPTEEPTPEPTEEPTEAPTEEPTPTPEPTAEPKLTAEAADSADPSLISSSKVYSGSKVVKDYSRPTKDLIHMPVGGEYTRKERMGILTFRKDAFRQNAAVGTVSNPTELSKVWSVEVSSARGVSTTYYGIGWTGQPAIVQWTKEVREKSQLEEGKAEKTKLKEVIIAGLDGNVYFLDLDDGTRTRNSIRLGYPMKGTPSVHPGGAPYMNVGQFARKMKVKTGKIGLRQYNLYKGTEITPLIDGLDGKLHRGVNDVGSFETSALIDRTSDTVITAGTNGLLYLISLQPSFDYVLGLYSQDTSTVVLASKAKTAKTNAQAAIEASIAMYDRYVYMADMSGALRCVDTNTLSTVWAVDTGDAVESTPALELAGDGLNLYTANLLMNRKKGNVTIRQLNALSGAELWSREIPVEKEKKSKEAVGVFASPVVGQNDLKNLVYYTVTGLSEEGRAELGLHGAEVSALIAMEKATGAVQWVFGMDQACISSPVAVYDEEGRGWIIQCAADGTLTLMDGKTGQNITSLKINGEIEASPAVYDDMLIIGTTGRKTSFVYGIRIQ